MNDNETSADGTAARKEYKNHSLDLIIISIFCSLMWSKADLKAMRNVRGTLSEDKGTEKSITVQEHCQFVVVLTVRSSEVVSA